MKDFKRERQYFSLVSTCIIFIILQSWWIAALKCPLRTKVTESKRFVSKVQLYLPPPPPLTNKLMQIDSLSLCLSFKNPLGFIPVWQWQIVAEVEHSKHKLFDYTPSSSLQCQIKKKRVWPSGRPTAMKSICHCYSIHRVSPWWEMPICFRPIIRLAKGHHSSLYFYWSTHTTFIRYMRCSK